MPKIVQNVSVILLIIYDLWVLPIVVFAMTPYRSDGSRISKILDALSLSFMKVTDSIGTGILLGLIAVFFIPCFIYLKKKKELALGYVMIVVVLYALAVFISVAARLSLVTIYFKM